jgi:hypothetical protein
MITTGLTNTVPENLVVDGIPAIPAALQADAGRYLDFRSAAFQGWHPQRREMIILTRFADTPQLHWVAAPGGARRQLTFLAEPVKGGGFRPKTGECIVFSQDVGGTEMFQLHRYDLARDSLPGQLFGIDRRCTCGRAVLDHVSAEDSGFRRRMNRKPGISVLNRIGGPRSFAPSITLN